MKGCRRKTAPVLTLTTDFGQRDGYVAMMKGVILSICPSAEIVDITHDIDPQDVREAAFRFHSAFRFFPTGTVHVVVVDPGVGTARAAIAMKTGAYVFVFPDNGILSLVVEQEKPSQVVKLDNPLYFMDAVTTTFHGRDIFAPVAAYLADGVPIERLGTPLRPDKLVCLKTDRPQLSELLNGRGRQLTGRIASIDRFGNLVTNIDQTALVDLLDGSGMLANMVVSVHTAGGTTVLHGIANTYGAVSEKEPLALPGSSGYLEIAVNCGNAAHFFQAEKGDRISVQQAEEKVN